MRSQVLASLLLLIAPAISSPTPGDKNADCYKTVRYPQSIQEAINKARPGDIITVEEGTYKEQLTIKKSGITLIGKKAVLVPPSKFEKNICSGLNENFVGEKTEAGICIQGKGIELEKFAREHRKFKSAREYIKDVTVTGFEVRGFSGENIAVVAGKDIKVTKNKLVDGAQYGFLTVGSKNTLAAGNIIESATPPFLNFIAMCMDDQSNAKFKENNISGYYIALCTQTQGGEVIKNTVKNCCIGPFVDPGIKGARVIGNTITNRNPACPTSKTENGGGPAGAGIILSGASNTVVKDNTIEYISFGEAFNITSGDVGLGIFVNDDPVTGAKAKGNVVKNNKLQFNDFDIFNNATSTDNVIANNRCARVEGTTTFCDGL
ncbi:pectin lyase fold/virulence factor [Pyrenochaeta sp. MPI-SDFR-AT-0127]|nr:pectin lyase fold/virulence factor [Pyrenochaeta sp. MPI-SDFR-AT-0127]